MTKFSILGFLVLLVAVGCGPQKQPKRPTENSIRARAEKAACGLSDSLFSVPAGGALLTTPIENREDLKGKYYLLKVEIYQYAEGVATGSIRTDFELPVEGEIEVQAKEVCDSNGSIEVEGPSEFNLPGTVVTEKFLAQGKQLKKNALQTSAFELLRKSGDHKNVPSSGDLTSVQIFTLKEGGLVIVTTVYTKESVTVTRATYSFTKPPAEQPEQTVQQ